jgi:SAM-dependent methyltransferase
MPDEPLLTAAEMWGGADYERVAQRFAAIHDLLVSRLSPRSGERWLDVATGTGEVAVRAARTGAAVTGLDIAPRLLEQARAKSFDVAWVEGDAQALPFEDGSFDVVSSCFGLIFAPDQEAAATELARVCDDRLGLTVWRPNEGPHAIYAAFSGDQSTRSSDDWGREDRLRELLGGAFELEIEEHVWWLEGESPEDVFDLMSNGAPPLRALFDSLEPDRAAAFREAMLEHWSHFQTPEGVREPRRYLLVLGRKRRWRR